MTPEKVHMWADRRFMVTRRNARKEAHIASDEHIGIIVRFIYEKFVEKESYTAVADELNRRYINSPSFYISPLDNRLWRTN